MRGQYTFCNSPAGLPDICFGTPAPQRRSNPQRRSATLEHRKWRNVGPSRGVFSNRPDLTTDSFSTDIFSKTTRKSQLRTNQFSESPAGPYGNRRKGLDTPHARPDGQGNSSDVPQTDKSLAGPYGNRRKGLDTPRARPNGHGTSSDVPRAYKPSRSDNLGETERADVLGNRSTSNVPLCLNPAVPYMRTCLNLNTFLTSAERSTPVFEASIPSKPKE